MTRMLFRDDAYLKEAEACVMDLTPEGHIVLDQSVFYPRGGGQPGDSGTLTWDGGELRIAEAVKHGDDAIALVAVEDGGRPTPGSTVTQRLDWDRRHAHMRVHTALHLLSVVIPLPVTGGAITAEKGRLDFDMPESPDDRDAVEEALNALVERDLPVSEDWITDEELAANPGLVKTMSVQPPVGQGRVRLVRIGTGPEQVDLQPCGGTHVSRTAEIGRLRLGKIEKKGRQNRRVSIHLADED